MPNKPLRYSCNREMLWIIRIVVLLVFLLTVSYFAVYFGMKSHRQEKELVNLKQNASFLPKEFGILEGD